MTYRCSSCDVAWWPYRAQGGVCPMCGGGTTCLHDEPTDRRRLRVGDAQAPSTSEVPDTVAALLAIWERESGRPA